MSKGKDELTRVNPDVIWPLPVLDRAARRRCTNGSASKGGTLSEETQLLLQKEKAIPKQVRAYLVSSTCIVVWKTLSLNYHGYPPKAMKL